MIENQEIFPFPSFTPLSTPQQLAPYTPLIHFHFEVVFPPASPSRHPLVDVEQIEFPPTPQFSRINTPSFNGEPSSVFSPISSRPINQDVSASVSETDPANSSFGDVKFTETLST